MIYFNELLLKAGIDLTRTKLVRHRDNRAASGRTPYDLWAANDPDFELYQKIQTKEEFKNAEWIVSFVTTPLNETIFAGIYHVLSVGKALAGLLDPIGGHDVGGKFLYNLALDERLTEYIGRIVVDWGPGYRSWVQRADNQNKKILEIRRDRTERPFPGFSDFRWPIQHLNTVPRTWIPVLSAVSGIYLLVCKEIGKQYVGSASGAGGLWARWQEYFKSGHGGNVDLKRLQSHNYQVSILEIWTGDLDDRAIEKIETKWKHKLLSREFGYNKN